VTDNQFQRGKRLPGNPAVPGACRLQHLEDIEPITVAAYIEALQRQAAPVCCEYGGANLGETLSHCTLNRRQLFFAVKSRSSALGDQFCSLFAEQSPCFAVKSLTPEEAEIVVLDEQGVSRFELLQRFQRDRKGALIYYVFDLLYLKFFRAARQQK
jgi:hypothetical protein